jgi:hypothetical protein
VAFDGAKNFQNDIDAFVEQLERRSKLLEEEVTTELAKTLYQVSPVKTGFFRSQWTQVPASAAVQKVRDVNVRGFRFNAIVFKNETPYGLTIIPKRRIPGLEGGRSKQAPAGILGPTLNRLWNAWDRLVVRARLR